ncbi:MAG: type II secretion system ATPase GspE [Gammaproteobacteria bacterium]|nr:type II secretion system ATPase GspE [Gammaproteobacteria bacterium]NNJ97788.1 type II secretion system ATPase GspE [Gammaproteobacteria bacterium]
MSGIGTMTTTTSKTIGDQPEISQPQELTPQVLSYAFAKRHGVLIGQIEDDQVQLLHRPDFRPTILAEIGRVTGRKLSLSPASNEQFDALLAQTYERASDQAIAMMEGVGEELDLDQLAETLEPEDLLEAEDDAPIIRLINALLTEAIKINASDVHIEPFENRMRVRFRVDGMLREILKPPGNIAPLVISRIKVMAKLDIAEKRLPQDGRISLRVAGRAVDVRVSTLPAGYGERVVMRLLDKQAGRLTLEHLGMAKEVETRFNTLLHKPDGIILVTGPTGSGKTTTLYAGLARLNVKSRNILTVEDPIEYYIDGIGQTQVNAKVGMSFARGLRSILRQDPDVVMIGEIRDLETATIAVQASLTGHLVLSTLHTNSAIGAITRLRDMGVEPFLLASSLIGVMAQRLVRKLCPACKKPHTATDSERQWLNLPAGQTPVIYTASSCGECNHLGYAGRTGVYEFVAIDDKLQDMIHDEEGEHAMEEYGRNHAATLRQDGRRLILEGITSLEEVLRVSRED